LLRQLPLIIELSAEQVHVMAHADYPPAVYRWQQPVDEQQVLWSRQRLTDHLPGVMARLPALTISGLAIRR
jgi:serine/threonine protein phosphatase 1